MGNEGVWSEWILDYATVMHKNHNIRAIFVSETYCIFNGMY